MSDVELNRPSLILSAASPALTERTYNAQDQFEKATLLDFIRRFFGRIYELEHELRDQGIDSSRLEAHLAQLINTQMFRLIAVDLNGMALQLENRRKQITSEEPVEIGVRENYRDE